MFFDAKTMRRTPKYAVNILKKTAKIHSEYCSGSNLVVNFGCFERFGRFDRYRGLQDEYVGIDQTAKIESEASDSKPIRGPLSGGVDSHELR